MSHDLDSIIQQSVNLYQAEFRPKREWMTLLQCGFLLVLFLTGLGAYTWYAQQDQAIYDEQLAELTRQESQLSDQIVSISQAQRKKMGQGIHDEEIALKEADLAARKALLESLVGDVKASTEGFSNYLEALSRQHVTGSWLTGLEIAEGGETLSIEGQVLRSELAPEYMIRLANEPTFMGKGFSVVKITRSPQVDETTELNDTLQFFISTNTRVDDGLEERL